MTHTQFLEREKAFAHTNSIRKGATHQESAAFMIAAARLAQAYADCGAAHECLLLAAELYAEGDAP